MQRASARIERLAQPRSRVMPGGSMSVGGMDLGSGMLTNPHSVGAEGVDFGDANAVMRHMLRRTMPSLPGAPSGADAKGSGGASRVGAGAPKLSTEARAEARQLMKDYGAWPAACTRAPQRRGR